MTDARARDPRHPQPTNPHRRVNDALGNCSPYLFGSQWWLDRLEQAAAAKRQIDRLERLPQE